LRHISWMGVIAGTAVALLAGRLMLFAMQDFYTMIAYQEGPRGTVVSSAERQMMADYVQLLVSAISWSFAYFLGGLVAGRIARSCAGLNGVLTAVLGTLFGVISLLAAVLPTVVGPTLPPVMRSENLGLLSLWMMLFAAFFPITVIVTYVGGRVGGHLRARALARAGA
jgi:hypothetical protein